MSFILPSSFMLKKHRCRELLSRRFYWHCTNHNRSLKSYGNEPICKSKNLFEGQMFTHQLVYAINLKLAKQQPYLSCRRADKCSMFGLGCLEELFWATQELLLGTSSLKFWRVLGKGGHIFTHIMQRCVSHSCVFLSSLHESCR